jgi:acyl-coenzyme A thioesterase PaaI-like protein
VRNDEQSALGSTVESCGTQDDAAADQPRPEANRCFVCGPSNPIGLHLQFRLDGDVCRAEFTPGPDHCGYSGMTHGGILYAALDDVMANWLHLQGVRAYTARCEVRYRHPVAVGEAIRLEGRLRRRRGPLALLDGVAVRVSDETVVAESEASFMIQEPA